MYRFTHFIPSIVYAHVYSPFQKDLQSWWSPWGVCRLTVWALERCREKLTMNSKKYSARKHEKWQLTHVDTLVYTKRVLPRIDMEWTCRKCGKCWRAAWVTKSFLWAAMQLFTLTMWRKRHRHRLIPNAMTWQSYPCDFDDILRKADTCESW